MRFHLIFYYGCDRIHKSIVTSGNRIKLYWFIISINPCIAIYSILDYIDKLTVIVYYGALYYLYIKCRYKSLIRYIDFIKYKIKLLAAKYLNIKIISLNIIRLSVILYLILVLVLIYYAHHLYFQNVLMIITSLLIIVSEQYGYSFYDLYYNFERIYLFSLTELDSIYLISLLVASLMLFFMIMISCISRGGEYLYAKIKSNKHTIIVYWNTWFLLYPVLLVYFFIVGLYLILIQKPVNYISQGIKPL